MKSTEELREKRETLKLPKVLRHDPIFILERSF